MRVLPLVLALGITLSPAGAAGQANSAPSTSMERPDQWRATVTIFRSPGTGLQLQRRHLALFLGFYPTVIKREGEQRNTNFIRLGAAYYAAPDARTSPYASLAFAPSLTKGWSNSVIADVGVRRMFTTRFSGQIGVAVLHAPESKQTRVNPTIGLGVLY